MFFPEMILISLFQFSRETYHTKNLFSHHKMGQNLFYIFLVWLVVRVYEPLGDLMGAGKVTVHFIFVVGRPALVPGTPRTFAPRLLQDLLYGLLTVGPEVVKKMPV